MAGAMRKMGVYLGLVEDGVEHFDEYDEYEDYDGAARREAPAERADHTRSLQPVREERPAPAPAPRTVRTEPRTEPRREPRLEPRHDTLDSYKITTLHPRNYNDARTVGEYFREGTPVIMNLTDMDDSDAKRLVDFSAGLIFGLHGSIERVTAKVFLLSPANVVVTAEEKARLAEGGFFNQS